MIMPNFSVLSEVKLKTCHYDIQTVIRTVIQRIDFSIIWGHRGNELQQQLYESGFSDKKAGESKHNLMPSEAIDIAPYPINWEDKKRFYYLAGMVMMTAWELNIKLRWGGDWNMNDNLNDQKLFDLGHFELFKTE